MTKILFIGDSITQDDRFDDKENIGNGYVALISDFLKIHYPEKLFQIINRGINGDEIIHLESRWDKDVIAHNADFVSISVGINDVWGKINEEKIDLKHVNTFKEKYDALIQETIEKCHSKIILMEPTFISHHKHANGENYLSYYVEAVRELSNKYNTILVPLYDDFYNYTKTFPNNFLTTDGIHMTRLGTMLIASNWLKAFCNTNPI